MEGFQIVPGTLVKQFYTLLSKRNKTKLKLVLIFCMNCAFRHNFIIYNYAQSLAPKKKRKRSEKALIPKPIILSFVDKQVKYDTGA